MHFPAHAAADNPRAALDLRVAKLGRAAARVPAVVEQAVIARNVVEHNVSVLARNRAVDLRVFDECQIVAAVEAFGPVHVYHAPDVGPGLAKADLRRIGRAFADYQPGCRLRSTAVRLLRSGIHRHPLFARFRQAGGCFHLHPQIFGEPATGGSQRVVDLLLQVGAEKTPRENADAALFQSAQVHTQKIEREDLLAAGAVALFADPVDHRQADFGELRRFIGIGRRSERRFEKRSSKSFQVVSKIHGILSTWQAGRPTLQNGRPGGLPYCNSPSCPAASITSLAIGAAALPPYPPCSTNTANASLREASPS